MTAFGVVRVVLAVAIAAAPALVTIGCASAGATRIAECASAGPEVYAREIDRLTGANKYWTPEASAALEELDAAVNEYQSKIRETLHPRMHDTSVAFSLLEGDWDDPRHAMGRAALDAAADLDGLLASAAAHEKFISPYADWLSDQAGDATADPLMHRVELALGVFRRTAAAMNVAMLRRDAAAGDWESAGDRLERSMRIGRIVGTEGGLLPALVGMSVQGPVLNELFASAVEYNMPAYEARRARWSIRELRLESNRVRRYVLEVERLLLEDFMHWLHCRADIEDSAGFVELLARIAAPSPPYGWPIFEDWYEQSEEYQAEVRAGYDRIERPLRINIEEVRARFDELSAWWRLPATVAAEQEPEWSIFHASGSVFTRFRRSYNLLETNSAGAVALTYLLEYRAEHGRWPDSLLDAAPAHATIDPTSGEPFIYEVTPDGPTPIRLAIPPAAAKALFGDNLEQFEREAELVTPRRPIDERYMPWLAQEEGEE